MLVCVITLWVVGCEMLEYIDLCFMLMLMYAFTVLVLFDCHVDVDVCIYSTCAF